MRKAKRQRVKQPFFIPIGESLFGFTTPDAEYGHVDDHDKVRRIFIKSKKPTVKLLTELAIDGSALNYTPDQVVLFAKNWDSSEMRPLSTDYEVSVWLNSDAATIDDEGYTHLNVCAINSEETELQLSHVRMPLSMDGLDDIMAPGPTHAWSPEDKLVLSGLMTAHRDLKLPTHRDDWLAQNVESREPIANERWGSVSALKIHLVPIKLAGTPPLPLEEIRRYLEAFFGVDVVTTAPVILTRPTKQNGSARMTLPFSSTVLSVGYRTFCAAAETEMAHGQFKAGGRS